MPCNKHLSPWWPSHHQTHLAPTRLSHLPCRHRQLPLHQAVIHTHNQREIPHHRSQLLMSWLLKLKPLEHQKRRMLLKRRNLQRNLVRFYVVVFPSSNYPWTKGLGILCVPVACSIYMLPLCIYCIFCDCIVCSSSNHLLVMLLRILMLNFLHMFDICISFWPPQLNSCSICWCFSWRVAAKEPSIFTGDSRCETW